MSLLDDFKAGKDFTNFLNKNNQQVNSETNLENLPEETTPEESVGFGGNVFRTLVGAGRDLTQGTLDFAKKKTFFLGNKKKIPPPEIRKKCPESGFFRCPGHPKIDFPGACGGHFFDFFGACGGHAPVSAAWGRRQLPQTWRGRWRT